MTDDILDPFETAAENARIEIEPAPLASSNGDVDHEATFDDVPIRRPRGRPKGRSGSRSRRSTRRGRVSRATTDTQTESQQTARVQAPPAPPLKLEPLPPEKLLPMLRQLDKTFTRMIGTAPLDEQELKDGAEACAPVLDHYAPYILSQPWAGAALWAAMVYVPRLDEVYARRKQGGGRKPGTFPVTVSDPHPSAAPLDDTLAARPLS